MHDNPGNAISWSSDGATLAMAHTRQIARWDLNEGNKPLVGAVTFGTIWSELARADLGARRGPALAECYGERFYRWAKDELEGKHAKPPSPEIVRQVGTLVTKALAKEPEDLVAFLGTSEASARQAALPAVAAALANGLDSDNFFTREAASAAVEAAAGALANDPERGQLLREIHRVARKLESLEARRRTERLARALGTSLEENASASHQRGALMQVLEGIDKPGPEATALLDYLRKTGG